MKQTINRTRVAIVLIAAGVLGLAAAITAQGTAKVPGNMWPPAKKQMAKSIPLTPEEEMQTFMRSAEFRRNPDGHEIDPEEYFAPGGEAAGYSGVRR